MDPGRLKSLPLFEGVSDEELSHIAPFVDETSVSEGTHLVDEGDYSYQFMAIEDGTAAVVRGGEKLADLGPGDFFGEMGLLEDARRSATVTATSPLRVVVMTAQAFRHTARELPGVAAKLSAAIEERGRHLEPA